MFIVLDIVRLGVVIDLLLYLEDDLIIMVLRFVLVILYYVIDVVFGLVDIMYVIVIELEVWIEYDDWDIEIVGIFIKLGVNL